MTVLDIFTYLNRGGSIGSFCISTMRITLCLAPELKATPCWDGVYLEERQRVSPWIKHFPLHAYINMSLEIDNHCVLKCVRTWDPSHHSLNVASYELTVLKTILLSLQTFCVLQWFKNLIHTWCTVQELVCLQLSQAWQQRSFETPVYPGQLGSSPSATEDMCLNADRLATSPSFNSVYIKAKYHKIVCLIVIRETKWFNTFTLQYGRVQTHVGILKNWKFYYFLQFTCDTKYFWLHNNIFTVIWQVDKL